MKLNKIKKIGLATDIIGKEEMGKTKTIIMEIMIHCKINFIKLKQLK